MSLELSNVSSRSHIFTLSQDSDPQMESDAKSYHKHSRNLKNANIAYQRFIQKLGMLFEFQTVDLDALYNKIVQCTKYSDNLVESSDQEIADMIKIAKQLKQNNSILRNMIEILDKKYIGNKVQASSQFDTNKQAIVSSTIANTKQKEQQNIAEFQFRKNKVNKISMKNVHHDEDPFLSEDSSITNFFKTPVQQLQSYSNTQETRPFFKNVPHTQSRKSSTSKSSRKGKKSLSKEKKQKFEYKLKQLSEQMKIIRKQISELEAKNWQSQSNCEILENMQPQVLKSLIIQQDHSKQQQTNNTHLDKMIYTDNQTYSTINKIYPEHTSITHTKEQIFATKANSQQFHPQNTQNTNQSERNSLQLKQQRKQESRGRKRSQEKVYEALEKLETRNKILQKYIKSIQNSIHEGTTKNASQSEHQYSISNVVYAEPQQLASDMAKKKHLHEQIKYKSEQIETLKKSLDLQSNHHHNQQKDHEQPYCPYKQNKDGHQQHRHTYKLVNDYYQNDEIEQNAEIDECSLGTSHFNNPSNHKLTDQQHFNRQVLIPQKSGSSIFKNTRNVQSKLELSDEGSHRNAGSQIKKIKQTMTEMFKKLEPIEVEKRDHETITENRTVIMKDSGVGDFNVFEPQSQIGNHYRVGLKQEVKPLKFSYQSASSSNYGYMSKQSINKPINHKMLVTFHPQQRHIERNIPIYPQNNVYMSNVSVNQSNSIENKVIVNNKSRQGSRSRQIEKSRQRYIDRQRQRSRSIEYRNIRQSPVKRLQSKDFLPFASPKRFLPSHSTQILPQTTLSPKYQNYRSQISQPPLINHPPLPPKPQLIHIKSNPNLNRIHPSYSQYPPRQFEQLPQQRTKTISQMIPQRQYHPSFIQSKIIIPSNPPFRQTMYDRRQNSEAQNRSASQSGSQGHSRSRSRHSKKGISIVDCRKKHHNDFYA